MKTYRTTKETFAKLKNMNTEELVDYLYSKSSSCIASVHLDRVDFEEDRIIVHDIGVDKGAFTIDNTFEILPTGKTSYVI